LTNPLLPVIVITQEDEKMFFPFRETTKQAIIAILPKNDHIISIEQISGLEELEMDLRKGFQPIIRIMLTIVAICLWQMTPLLTIGRWSKATSLTPDDRDSHTHLLSKSRYYFVRHSMTLLKAFAMLHWGRSNTVRAVVSISAYPTDPQTCREGLGLSEDRHISFRDKGENVEDISVDIVIVGSGPGAVACAERIFSESGHRYSVAMVEAGPFREAKDYPYTTLGAMRDMMDGEGAIGAFGRSISTVLAGRVVGGGSVINSGIMVYTPEDVFALMRDRYGLFYGEPARLQSAIRDVLTHEERIAKLLKVSNLSDLSIGRATKEIVRSAKRLGLYDHDILKNMPNCLGSGQCLQGCKAEKKQSLDRWISRMLEEESLYLLSSAPVSRVLMRYGRAIGVTGKFVHPLTRETGAKFTVRARRAVILSASAIGTPCILERSKVSLPMVGRGFIAHPGSPLQAVYEDGVNNNLGSTQDWASMAGRDRGFKLETCRVPLTEVASSRFPGAGRELAKHLSHLPNSVISVCVSRGAYSIGSVNALPGNQKLIRYSISPLDIETIREGLYELARINFEAGALQIFPGIYGVPDVLVPGEESKILEASTDPRAYTTVLSHLMGAARMGRNIDSGVCDERGRVFETENLYIADSSMLPVTLGVNPQLTIMGFAARAADAVLRDLE
jgi:choline dehydrogenase-like flavoprotein